MKPLLLFLITISALCCSPDTQERELDTIGSYINAYPDSALAELEQMDLDLLKGDKAIARYSLLYSIALDKNYIDLTSDSIIRPAVQYYSKKGSDNDKAYTYFYLARIYQNMGDYDSTMLALTKALDTDSSEVEYNILKRIHMLKGNMYSSIWRHSDALDSYRQAAYNSEKDKDTTYLFHSWLNTAQMSLLLNNYSECSKYLSMAEPYKEKCAPSRLHYYEGIYINLLISSESHPEQLQEYIENYINTYPKDEINWMAVTRAYVKLKETSNALTSLNNYKIYGGDIEEPSYHSILSDIYEQRGEYKLSLEAYKEFSAIQGTLDLDIYESDLRIIEERYKADIESYKRENQKRLYISLLSLLVILSISIVIKYWMERGRIKNLNKEFDTLKKVEKHYQDILKIIPESDIANEKEIIKNRLISFSSFMESPKPDSISKVATQLEMVKRNRDQIVENIAILYGIRYPEFINYLKDFDLSVREIGFCCLYLLGLYTEDIKLIIDRKNIYNINLKIRKKLQIPSNETNLDLWLKKRFYETYPDFTNGSHHRN
jgi:tetratricopeptide (TPR) repeat protein